MKKAFAVGAVALFVLLGVNTGVVEAKQKCDDSVPPVCESVRSSGRRHASYFFEVLGLNVSAKEQAKIWSNKDSRNRIMAAWRLQTFGHR